MLQITALVFAFCVGGICGSFLKLYFSLKNFVEEVINKSIPEDAINEALSRIKNKWIRFISTKVILLLRSKLADRFFKLITAPETIAGFLVKIIAIILVALIFSAVGFCTWYFEVSSFWLVISQLIFGYACGYFCLKATVDKALAYLIESISGVSHKMILKVADTIGKEVHKEVKIEA